MVLAHATGYVRGGVGLGGSSHFRRGRYHSSAFPSLLCTFLANPNEFPDAPTAPGVAQVPRPAVSVLLPTPVDRKGRHCGLEVRAHPNRRGGPLRPPINRPPARRPIQTRSVNTGIDRPTRPLLIGRLGFQAAQRHLNASPGRQPGDRFPSLSLLIRPWALGFQAAQRRLNASPGCQPGDWSPNTPLLIRCLVSKPRSGALILAPGANPG